MQKKEERNEAQSDGVKKEGWERKRVRASRIEEESRRQQNE